MMFSNHKKFRYDKNALPQWLKNSTYSAEYLHNYKSQFEVLNQQQYISSQVRKLSRIFFFGAESI